MSGYYDTCKGIWVEPEPAAQPADTLSGVDLNAVKTLVAHQRRDIGSCICGWGVDTGDLGRLHSLHVWRELQRAVLPDHDAREREALAQHFTNLANLATSEGRRTHSKEMHTAAAIARAHRTTPEPGDG